MLPSGFLAWMNKKNPDAAFTDDEDLEAFFNDEEDGGELLDYYIGLYNDSAEHDAQLKLDRDETDAFVSGTEPSVDDGWDDDDFDDDDFDDDDDLDFSNGDHETDSDGDHETDSDADGTHYIEKVDVNGDGDTDILEVCTDGDGEAEITVTNADSADEQKMIDEHKKLDEARDTYRNIANALSDHRF